MAGKIDYKDLPPLNPEVKELMSKELNLSILLGVIYWIFILSVPLINFLAPGLAAAKVMGGMNLSWFMTSILAMVMATLIAGLHVYINQKRWSEVEIDSDYNPSKGVHH